MNYDDLEEKEKENIDSLKVRLFINIYDTNMLGVPRTVENCQWAFMKAVTGSSDESTDKLSEKEYYGCLFLGLINKILKVHTDRYRDKDILWEELIFYAEKLKRYCTRQEKVLVDQTIVNARQRSEASKVRRARVKQKEVLYVQED